MNKHLNILTIMLILAMLLVTTSCYQQQYDYTSMAESSVNSSNVDANVVALDKVDDNQIMKLVKRGYSNYGYIQLGGELKIAYKDVEQALFNLEEKVVVSEEVFEQFNILLRYISSDNPLFFWEPNEIHYSPKIGGGYIMSFNYDFTREEVLDILTEIDEVATEYCNSIPSELSSFDKALIVHDKIVSSIEYDKNYSNVWRNDVYGGLINNYATCLGYSKTYQYLMCRMSIDTLMSYGYGGDEQHAWNIINLDGSYYHVDTTFNDTSTPELSDDGFTFIQHEYAFLTDEEISKTHEILSTEFGSYPLPICDNTQKNYFNMKDLVVKSDDTSTIKSDMQQILGNAISEALAQKNGLIEIKFDNEDIADEIMRNIKNGELDSSVTMLCKLRGINNVDSRSYVPEHRILTYYFS